MGDEIVIDAQVFWERLSKLHKAWGAAREADGVWKGADALVLDSGTHNEEEIYSKSAAIHTWLFGWELPETIITVCSRSVHILTGKSKVNLLQPLKTAENAVLPLELHARNKTDGNAANYAALVTSLRSSHAGGVVATLGKEKPEGEFATAWRSNLASSGLATVELAPALADLLAPKDSTETSNTKRAGIFSSMLMTKHLVAKLEAVVDAETKISHEKLAQDAEDAFAEPIKLGVKLAPEHLESAYNPIIQSGGVFDLKPSAQSDERNLYYGTITASLGARYKSYCANVARTYFVNPTKGQEKVYKLLLELQQEAISALRVGAPLNAAYQAASNRLKSKAAHLEKNFTKNVGFGTGIEFREASLQLNAKNEARVRAGMTFNVAVGLENLEAPDATDKRGKVYAMFLADTVVVKEEGAPEVFTERAPKAWADVSYSLKDDDDDDDSVKVTTGKRGEVELTSNRTRNAGRGVSQNLETAELLADHQSELAEKTRLDALARIKRGEGGAAGPSGPVVTPIAYRDPNAYPGQTQLRTNVTHVDGKAEAVLIPVFGRLVPFHISTIKNVSKNDEGGYTFLRINFVAPGPGAATGQMPKEALADDHFLREITLKSRVPANLNNTFRLIKELRKRVTAREKQVAIERDIVAQEAIQLIRTGKIHRLRDVNVRPNVGGKKAAGTLELHANGLRFQAARGEKLDLIFKNIKLALFQAAEKEILVLLHFHLHDPIMIGKKKTKDVQFYVEIMEASYALDATRRSGYDPDELEEEQRERQLRKRMNAEFQNFVKLVEEQAGNMEFDIPYRDLGFYGVPPHNKSTCYVMPAVHALVELTEPPWFVVPLEDIEVAHFERIVYGLKNFDLVFVMKDFSVKPVTVSAINTEHLDPLKTWLDSCDIKFYEGPANLNWTQIMKHINSMGLEEFYEEGGWKNVLELEDSEGEEGEDPEDAESDFNPSGSSEEEEEDSEDEYDEEEVDSEDEDSGEESMDSDESEGKDFETLEKEAKRADKEKGKYDEDERPKSKKRQDYSASEDSDSDSGERPPKKASKSSGGGSSKGAKPSSSKHSSSKHSSSKHSSSKHSSSKPSSSKSGGSGKFFKRA